ncbi:MAG: sensor histidine kinase [Limisphaerales bacterium]
MLTQALHNLLRNAVEYNCEGGFVCVSAAANNRHVEVQIANSGPVIEESLQEELFGRFCKGANGGHGLGLNIVQEIIEAHGGHIHLESSTDQETLFELQLPMESS